MQITISFNPEVDHFDTVLTHLAGAYGEDAQFILNAIDAALNSEVAHDITMQGMPIARKVTPTFNVTELVESQVLTDEPAIIVDAEQIAEQLPPAMKATLEIDVDGVPWDARIHSDAAEPQTQAGRWKKKRGVDAEEYDRITRELQLLASGKVGTDELPIPTLPTVQPELELPLVDLVQIKTLNTPPAPEGVTIPTTHVDLMKWVATQLAAKSLETTDITEVIKAGNLNNLGELEHMGEEWIKWAFESLQVRLK